MDANPTPDPERAAYDAFCKKRDALTADLDILVAIHARSMPATEVTLSLLLYAVQSAFMNGKTFDQIFSAVKVIQKHNSKA